MFSSLTSNNYSITSYGALVVPVYMRVLKDLNIGLRYLRTKRSFSRDGLQCDGFVFFLDFPGYFLLFLSTGPGKKLLDNCLRLTSQIYPCFPG